jgi:hypothetical protein
LRDEEANSLHLGWKTAFVINTMEWLSPQQRSEESLCQQRRKAPKAVKEEKEEPANEV